MIVSPSADERLVCHAFKLDQYGNMILMIKSPAEMNQI